MTLITQNKLIETFQPYAVSRTVIDVRVGLGYTAVRLNDGQVGVASTPPPSATCCTHYSAAGTLVGRPAQDLLAMLGERNSSLMRALGLATANALVESMPPRQASYEEVIGTLAITAGEPVAMVGYFGPIIGQLEQLGCKLDIIELKTDKAGTLTPELGWRALKECSVAIITGTSLINGTFDNLNSNLGKPRAAVLLGPSTPLCPQVFSDTKITHLAGARIKEGGKVLRVVSEGGGTMRMKPWLSFEHTRVKG